MSKIKLSCPHCGYSKGVEQDMIPHDAVRLKCPKCSESFVFNVKDAEPVPEPAAPPSAEAPTVVEAPRPVIPSPPSAPAVTDDEDGRDEKVRAVCPACGFFRKISAGLIPPEGKRVKCPRCKESFTVGGPDEAGEEPQLGELSGQMGEPMAAVPEDRVPTEADRPADKGMFDESGLGGRPPFEGPVTGAPVEEHGRVPEMPEPEYPVHGMGDLSGYMGEDVGGDIEAAEFVEPEYPEMAGSEDNIFAGEPGVPVSDETFPPHPEYEPDYSETPVGELSGHMESIVPEAVEPEPDEEKTVPYFPARNIPQPPPGEAGAEPTVPDQPAGGGYSVTLPDDLVEAAGAMADDEIEVIPVPDGGTEGEPSEEAEEAAYGGGMPQRPKTYDAHKYAVTADLDELLKEPEKKPEPQEEDYEEVTRIDVTPRDGGITELTEIGTLWREAWALMRSRAGTFIPLMLTGPILGFLSFGIFYGIGLLAATALPDNALILKSSFAGLGMLASVYLLAWWLAAFFQAVADETLRAREAFEVTRGMAGSMIWLVFISGVVITGGYFLFFLPGVLMTVWFAFSYFILISEDERGLSAMIKSREYVRGNWFGVFIRLFLISLISFVVVIPFAGIILLWLCLPFMATFCFLIYLDLKDIKGIMVIRPTIASKATFVVLGVFGLLMPVVFSVLLLSGGAIGALGERVGLDSESILAGIMGADEDVRAAYSEYRDAVRSWNAEELEGSVSGAFMARLNEETDDPLGYLEGSGPSDADVLGVVFRNSRAYLDLESTQPGGVVVGRAEMIKEGGDWVVDYDEWSMQVRPRPVNLGGGEPAVEFQPVDMSLISPGPLFGVAEPASFMDIKTKTVKELLRLEGHDEGVSRVRFLPDGMSLVSASYGERNVVLWDIKTGEIIDEVSLQNRPVGMDVTPDGKTVILSDAYGNYVFLKTSEAGLGSPEVLGAKLGHESRLKVSPNGLLVASASFDKLVTVRDIVGRGEVVRIETPEPMRELAFSPAGDLLAASSATNKFTVWKLDEGSGRTYTIPEVDEKSDVASIDISPDGKYLITGHMDSTITVWDLPRQKEVFNYFVKDASTFAVEFCPDGACFASAQQDSIVYVWETVTTKRLAALEGHDGAVNCLSFSPDGRLLASGGEDGSVIVWGTVIPAAPAKGFESVPAVNVQVEAAAEAARPDATLSVGAATYAPGETVVVEFNAPPDALPDAWIGIVPEEVPHGDEITNDGSLVTGVTLDGLDSGEVELEAPAKPGKYGIRMFTSDDGGREAASTTIEVKE